MTTPILDVASAGHVQATSTGTADIKTLTPPAGVRGVYLTVSTTNAIVTFDGTAPGAANGLALIKDALPIFFPVAKAIQLASSAAASCVVNAMWVR
jgi:hypothetical protein